MSIDQWISEEPPASGSSLATLRQEAPANTPEAYFDLLRVTDGGECEIPVQPWVVAFWPANEVISHNTAYEVERWWPGLFGIGTNGGGELLALDTRTDSPWPVVVVSLSGGTQEDIEVVASDFKSFAKMLGRTRDGDEGESRP